MRTFYVYILASRSGVLYIGMTNDLERRVAEHKAKRIPGFTADYNVDLLMWYESTRNVWEAIEFEKKLKGWSRQKKLDLIATKNPTMADLAEGWPGLPEKARRPVGPPPRKASVTQPPARGPSAAPLDDGGASDGGAWPSTVGARSAPSSREPSDAAVIGNHQSPKAAPRHPERSEGPRAGSTVVPPTDAPPATATAADPDVYPADRGREKRK